MDALDEDDALDALKHRHEMRAIEIAEEVKIEIDLEKAVVELGFRLETEIGAAALGILSMHVGRVIERRERPAEEADATECPRCDRTDKHGHHVAF